MTPKPAVKTDAAPRMDWEPAAQSLLAATLSATPTQRLAWLEEALALAYASGALKLRKPRQENAEGGMPPL